MKIKTWRDPYDSGFSPTKPTEIEINPGLTVLVGCNGAGKSTLLLNIKEHCKENMIACHLYDNLRSGHSNAMSELIANGDYSDVMDLMSSSEGECIKANIGRECSFYRNFFKTGRINNRKNQFLSLCMDEEKLKKQNDRYESCRDRVLLFDAVDSGLSVDSIVELKDMFDLILKDSKQFNVNVYLIIAANEYELAREANCFDVNRGKYIKFKDYEDYRDFILKSRKDKEKRIERQKDWVKNRQQKEIKNYLAFRTKAEERKAKLMAEYGDKELSWSEKRKLHDIDDKLRDFERECRYASHKALEEAWENRNKE